LAAFHFLIVEPAKSKIEKQLLLSKGKCILERQYRQYLDLCLYRFFLHWNL